MFEFEKPRIEIAEISEDNKYGRFVVEPLERGYGTTLGNSLRRIMLSSLPGAAVSAVKIKGVLHEFSSIPGVKEDVTEIIMNIKELSIKNNSSSNEPKRAFIEFSGEGVLLFEEKNSLLPEEREEIKKLFEALGIVIELPVHLMGIGGALTGCGPAFVDLIIEALGDAGVKYGVPRKQAYEMVSQMIIGSAKLQLETGEHPGVLKDNVCSPAGTTICGVDALEHAGIRAGFIDAIDAIMNK